MQPLKTYLAIGDSYTIGEAVLFQQNFPNQVVQMLRQAGHRFAAPEIIAKTGWTTDELAAGIAQHQFMQQYDFITLLIGVNNQYRGRAIEEFEQQFQQLLQQGINFADGKKERVIVVSIPDYGVTPFAANSDREKIAREIDAFNAAKKRITEAEGVHFVDITAGSREALTDATLVADDKLHPSAKEYKKWAEKVTEKIKMQL